MATDRLIDPDSFDMIVLGTGLQEAMLAASTAASGASVLHLDPHDFYGAHWTSLDFKQFSSWAAEGGRFSIPPLSPPAAESGPDSSSADDGIVAGPREFAAEAALGAGPGVLGFVEGPGELGSEEGRGELGPEELQGQLGPEEVPEESGSKEGRGEVRSDEGPELVLEEGEAGLGLEEIKLEFGKSFFSELKVDAYEGVSLGPSRSYSIDLCGPRLTFCGSNLVNILLRSGASHYVEFKGIDASYIWTGTGMSPVPSSRADVFKDRSLSLPDKRYLMRFFKLVTNYSTAEDQSSVDIATEDLDGPFLDFLQRQRLPASIQSYRAVPTGGHGW